MRIAFVIRALQAGGAETQLCLLATGLARRGHHVTVVTLYPGGLWWDKLLSDGTVTLTSVMKRGPLDLWRGVVRLRRLLIEGRHEVLYAFLFGGAIHAMASSIRLPMRRVVGLRGSAIDFAAYGIRYRVAVYAGIAAANQADQIIVNSGAGRDYYHSLGLRPGQSIVLPNGIDCDRFAPSEKARLAFRRENDLGDREFVVAVVGRLDPMKGHQDLLHACAQLNVDAAVRILMVGDGEPSYRRRLERLAEDLGLARKLSWLPIRGIIEQVYQGSDVLCLPSRFGEGFSNVVGEAMACGTFPLVTDVGDSRHIVGDYGVVVPPCNPEALRLGLQQIASMSLDDRIRIGLEARRRIIAEFSASQMIAATEAILERARRTDGSHEGN